MNVEAIEDTMSEFWPQWQNEVINGLYPLRRLLHGSDHSAVFLTECKAQDLPTAAIKIVPAERVTLAQLSQWKRAAELSHPHLVRLLDAGLCQLGGRQFLFVVMEYAEQTLSEVLVQRALTVEEVQEMLPPALDALAFLHARNLVQGQLKPANVLVVNDQLKLATDTVRPAGEPRASIAEPSLYDPPEADSGRLSPAGDIWAFGITMVEALTQRFPARPDEQSVTAGLPTTLPPAFVATVQRCLSHNPASRPTAGELEAQCKGAPLPAPAPAPTAAPVPEPTVAPTPSVVMAAQPVVREVPGRAAPAQESPKQRALPPIIAMVLTLLAVWAGVRLLQGRPNSRQPAASTIQPASQPGASARAAAAQTREVRPSAPVAVAAPAASAKSRNSKPTPSAPVSHPSDQPAPPPADASPDVVHEEIPSVPRSARETIHGHVRVAVLVIVDPAGNVSNVILEDPGPSRYFARLARDAARKWRFAAEDKQDSRQWLLRFAFARGETTGHATRRS